MGGRGLRRGRRGLGTALVAGLLGSLALGCGAAPGPGEGNGTDATRFSGVRALEHLEHLRDRASGRRKPEKRAKRVRRTLRKELGHLGLAVEEIRFEPSDAGDHDLQRVDLVSRVGSDDGRGAFVIVTPYAGRWTLPGDGAAERCTKGPEDLSGAAVLLELARLLRRDPLPYVTWLAFVDDRPVPEGDAPRFPGSHALARAFAAEGTRATVRLAVFVSGAAEPQVRMARDLRSHRTFRERFFRVARALEASEVFPDEGDLASVAAGHLAFLEEGERAVVALVGRPAEAAPPVEEEAGRRDRRHGCSAASLESVGRVVHAGLRDIAGLLGRIDGLGAPGTPGAGRPAGEARPGGS